MNAEWSSPLDRSGGVPLHVQLSRQLAAAARSGELGPVAPSEAALQQLYGVSRSVVRQALASLVATGVLDRSAGRSPLVVRAPYHRVPASSLGLAQQIEHVSTRVLSVENVEDDDFAGGAVRLERARSIEDQPIAYLRTILPRRFAAHLEDLENVSLHARLREHGVDLVVGPRTARAVLADEELAAVLRCAPGAPLLLLEGESRNGAGRLIERFSTWHVGDFVAFDIDTRTDPAASLPHAIALLKQATGLLEDLSPGR